MPNIFLISDTHFGHFNCYSFFNYDGTKMYPTIKDALLEASKNNASAETLAKMLAELVRSVMSGDADYGNDKHALEDSDRSMNSAFGKSDLTIVLPDDVYDALVKQRRENGESGDSGVRIMREHPLPQDADSSASEDSASGQSGADSNGASGGGASGAEENSGAESASSNGAQGADSDADSAQSTSGATATGASLGIKNCNTLPSPIPFQVQRYTFLRICYHLIP